MQGSIPEWLAVVIALLTQLGSVWFLVLVLTALYWTATDARDDIATVAGMAIAGMGCYKGLKEVFGLPRPEAPLIDPTLLPWLIEPLYEATATVGGYGFPSGHAVNTTVVYVGLAAVLPIGTRRLRYGAAAGLIVLVSFTRVALGVHYVVDVVVGAALGLALVGGFFWLFGRTRLDRPTVAFGLGVPFTAFLYVASDGGSSGRILLAAALGAFTGWQLVVLGRRVAAEPPGTLAMRSLSARGLAALLAAVVLVVGTTDGPLFSVSTAAGLVGFATAAVVVVPVARHAGRARSKRS
ncbi:phosphatase PAP2 family protein [Natronolimnohabitans innermongolicus]|uniref:phosphatase PAP2 family protein n=1 Tax=Natronolimnohabitans innermongolicus TaxID=253107 RepID=UPI001F4D06E7|nr:phosphatase PAP2 family protein [Natronolimnohabitans innermongolicus]